MPDKTQARPELPECTCAAKDMTFGRCCKAPALPEPIAVVGSGFTLFWAGSGPIAPLIETHGIRVGDGLYCAAQIRAMLADERRKALEEAIQRIRDEKAVNLSSVVVRLILRDMIDKEMT